MNVFSPEDGVAQGGHEDGGSAGTSGSPELLSLLRRSARGDQAAFAWLYDQTAPRVYAVVHAVVCDRAQSEALTRDVFAQIWRTSGQFDPTHGSALSWLLTIAHRTSVDAVRRLKSTRHCDHRYHRGAWAIAHNQTAPAEAVRRTEPAHGAMSMLTVPQREALELAYFGGHTYTEVAALLNLPTSTIKTRIRDGLIRVRG